MKKLSRKIVVLVSAIFLSLNMISASFADGHGKKILFSIKGPGSGNPFWASVTKGAEEEADPRLIDMHTIALTNMDLDQKGHYLMEFASKAVTITQRAISELYINSLLSSGVTHAVNLAGTGIFQIVRLAEKGIAGGIGEARTQMAKLVGSEKARGQDYMDRAYMGEMMIGAIGDVLALRDAFVLSARAGLRGEASDLATKLDLRGPAIGSVIRRAVSSLLSARCSERIRISLSVPLS